MPDDLDVSFLRCVGDVEGQSLLAELGDFTLDRFLDEGMLRDAPVVGGLFGLLRAGRNIRDFMFARKIANFLSNLQSTNEDARRKFADSIDADTGRRRRIGATVLMLLDRQTDLEQSRVLAFVFAEYLRGGIDYDLFARIADCIDRCLVIDLRLLPAVCKQTERRGTVSVGTLEAFAAQELQRLGLGDSAAYVMNGLQSAGFLELVQLPTIRGAGAESGYSVTRLGKTMARIVETIVW